MPIKIDLKDQPPAPFNFPHRCIESSTQFRVIATLLGGDEPWQVPDRGIPMSKVLAQRQVLPLVLAARDLLTVGASEALKEIPREAHDQEEPEYRALWLDSLRDKVAQHERSIRKALAGKYNQLVPPISELVSLLEGVGVLFLRLQQSFDPKRLPREIEVGP